MGEHVFISYCHENKAEVRKIREALITAGERVWWDEDILPGQDWKLEIDKAMEASYAVLACFSEETDRRYRSGIFPELRDAIERYRQYAPGSLFLFPVRLSMCRIPNFPIDGTRNLKDIQYTDLFPPAERDKAVNKLIKALKSAPAHP